MRPDPINAVLRFPDATPDMTVTLYAPVRMTDHIRLPDGSEYLVRSATGGSGSLPPCTETVLGADPLAPTGVDYVQKTLVISLDAV